MLYVVANTDTRVAATGSFYKHSQKLIMFVDSIIIVAYLEEPDMAADLMGR